MNGSDFKIVVFYINITTLDNIARHWSYRSRTAGVLIGRIRSLRTCQRFSKVASDKSLWGDVDFSDGCLSLQQVRQCLVFLRPNTRRVVLRGHKKKFAGTPKWKTPLISASLLKLIGEKCPNLEELTLKEAFVNANKVKMTDFAHVQSITKLSLVDCEFVNLPSLSKDASYFKKMHKTLPRLEVLEITKCGWVDDYDVMVLSKAEVVRRLVLRNLPKVGQAMVYIALGFRFGFQNLEELDLRGTSLEDNEVFSVVQNGKLRALYLGPLGPVKRLEKGPLARHNVIMPDPRRQEERQQVVVINVGPNGPQWRQVNDEELDDMGLDWVRNARAAQRRQDHELDDDRHYFIDKDGRPIEEEEEDGCSSGSSGSVAPQERAAKRRLLPHRGEPSAKQSRARRQPGHCHKDSPAHSDAEDSTLKEDEDGEEGEEDEEVEEFGPYSPNVEEDPNDSTLSDAPPSLDDHLSDKLVPAFGQKTKHLHTLVLAGCAITDRGLQEIVRLVPSLRLLDLTNTRVTSGALQEARVARPDCVILGGSTRPPRHHKSR
ncbi:F-box/LRR-repeat protein 12 [Portunus trituberculatus]|uniref:F-box/LRR-repeat protein 12 n=1 Tax=Portunus trituberculatus TaxID=210409 RepID=A0A5B7F116_PORTR|nr:F-box/LRR-repeat protein 12 [Portunus trituberculatus]